MQVMGIVVFAVTYALLSVRRIGRAGLDRPSAALIGAAACVLTGVLSPAAALDSIDGATLLLLFGVMGMGAFLAVDRWFERVEARVATLARTPAGLLAWIVWGAGVLSAFLTNDAVCVLGAPVVVRLVVRHGLPPTPYLLALATGANTGSVATLVGNPQNMLCGMLGGLEYGEFAIRLAPVAAIGLAVNHALLRFTVGRRLAALPRFVLVPDAPPESRDGAAPALAVARERRRSRLTLSVVGLTAVAYAAGADMAWTAASGFVVLLLLHRRDARELWPRIDWSLLVFFAGLFVVVEGFARTGVPAAFFDRVPLHAAEDLAGRLRTAAIFVLGCNVVSNVPFILVVRDAMAGLAEPRAGWELLAMASTFAGNLTLFGSMANLIVAEAARDVGGLGFRRHLAVGIPLTLATTAIGTVWLTWIG